MAVFIREHYLIHTNLTKYLRQNLESHNEKTLLVLRDKIWLFFLVFPFLAGLAKNVIPKFESPTDNKYDSPLNNEGKRMQTTPLN